MVGLTLDKNQVLRTFEGYMGTFYTEQKQLLFTISNACLPGKSNNKIQQFKQHLINFLLRAQI